MLISTIGSPLVAAGEDDGADQGGQQQHADRLEGQHVVAEDRGAERGGGGRGPVGDARLAEGAGEEHGQHGEHAGTDHEGADPRAQGVVEHPPADRRPGQHDAEQDQHHDRADVDDDLHEGHERGRQQQVEGGVHDVAAGHHQHAGQPADRGQDQERDLLASHDSPRCRARSLRAYAALALARAVRSDSPAAISRSKVAWSISTSRCSASPSGAPPRGSPDPSGACAAVPAALGAAAAGPAGAAVDAAGASAGAAGAAGGAAAAGAGGAAAAAAGGAAAAGAAGAWAPAGAAAAGADAAAALAASASLALRADSTSFGSTAPSSSGSGAGTV